jgi:hypothetical protein
MGRPAISFPTYWLGAAAGNAIVSSFWPPEPAMVKSVLREVPGGATIVALAE